MSKWKGLIFRLKVSGFSIAIIILILILCSQWNHGQNNNFTKMETAVVMDCICFVKTRNKWIWSLFVRWLINKIDVLSLTQLANTCSKLTIETLEQGMKYVQS